MEKKRIELLLPWCKHDGLTIILFPLTSFNYIFFQLNYFFYVLKGTLKTNIIPLCPKSLALS